jgi:hypothetical protein
VAPKVTTTPESEADATAGPQSPAELLDMMRGGLVFNGVRVLTLRVELADGTTQRLQLPAPHRGKAWAKTATGRKILDAMATESRPMKATTIAKLAGSEYSGSFRQTLKGLVDQGEVVSGEDGYELSG